ncbi:MAG: 16S rRNA (cytosine(1402)-N(4))-methyltransferase RsmH [Candidatus Kapabacteria bacterium]|nr:16S rRNA (cytosine(1402)-N(4))-methyltransferase RsmH [Candidatus Kapabacteria bacterium]
MKKKQNTSKYKKLKKSGVRALEYDYHLPVFLQKAVDYLVTDQRGIYLDGTLGGGGHSSEILKRLDGGKLYAFDKDPDAIEHCKNKFADELNLGGEEARLILKNESYIGACSIEEIGGKIKGLLLDLGVSSRQIDSDTRGFSYRLNTSLDMRFGSYGQSAEALIQAASEAELTKVFQVYGEEPFAKTIARQIILMRRARHFKSTFDLREAIENAVPQKFLIKSLSRVFQAIRIAVNDELGALEQTLHEIIKIMAPGARIVVISYHSLEDRIVKTFFKENSTYIKEHITENRLTNIVPKLKIITKSPIIPNDEEMQCNPRSRSAKMRVAEIIY